MQHNCTWCDSLSLMLQHCYYYY